MFDCVVGAVAELNLENVVTGLIVVAGAVWCVWKFVMTVVKAQRGEDIHCACGKCRSCANGNCCCAREGLSSDYDNNDDDFDSFDGDDVGDD